MWEQNVQPAENFKTKTRVLNSWLWVVRANPYPSIALVTTPLAAPGLVLGQARKSEQPGPEEKNKTGTTTGLRQPLINDTGWYSIIIITFHGGGDPPPPVLSEDRLQEEIQWAFKKQNKTKTELKGRSFSPRWKLTTFTVSILIVNIDPNSSFTSRKFGQERAFEQGTGKVRCANIQMAQGEKMRKVLTIFPFSSPVSFSLFFKRKGRKGFLNKCTGWGWGGSTLLSRNASFLF